jgi:hypothetical protein
MTPSLSRFKCMSVRETFLIIFLSLSLISLLITGIVAFYTIHDSGSYAEQSILALGGQR